MKLRAHRTKPELWLEFTPEEISHNAHRVGEWLFQLHTGLITPDALTAEGIAVVQTVNTSIFIRFDSIEKLKAWVDVRWFRELQEGSN